MRSVLGAGVPPEEAAMEGWTQEDFGSGRSLPNGTRWGVGVKLYALQCLHTRLTWSGL